jgi:hypothetical protein
MSTETTIAIASGYLAHFCAFKPRDRYRAKVDKFILRATGPFGSPSQVKSLAKMIVETFSQNKILKEIYLDDCVWSRAEALIFDNLLYEEAMATNFAVDQYTCHLCSRNSTPDVICAIDIEMKFV